MCQGHSDGLQTRFSVGVSIGTLFDVKVDNQIVNAPTDYFHVAYTSNITFNTAPAAGSNQTIASVGIKHTF